MSNLNNLWDNTKAFFKRSSVIFYSRLQSLSGFVLAVMGTIDWSVVKDWDFTTPKQTAWLGFGLIVNGTITEILRRRTIPAG